MFSIRPEKVESQKRFRLSYETNLIPISIIFGIILLFSSPSCHNSSMSTEIRRVDTLFGYTNWVDSKLIIDNDKLYTRLDSMKQNLDFLEQLDSTKVNYEFRYDINEYKALQNNFQKYLDQYEILQFDNKKYKQELHALKNKLIDKEISKQEFDDLFPGLKKDVKQHVAESRRLIQRILSQEKMYQRINAKIVKFKEQQELSTANKSNK